MTCSSAVNFKLSCTLRYTLAMKSSCVGLGFGLARAAWLSLVFGPTYFLSMNSCSSGASVGDEDLRTIFAEASSYGCVEGPVDASSVAGVRL
uniref:Uncharacterized protein n=1 Tax=Tanacetum cinerariifolium TaxID=118510 RepID=A0A699TT74_TANCI|nr:hypothetical protein [Tanacetum cinerariifolium]